MGQVVDTEDGYFDIDAGNYTESYAVSDVRRSYAESYAVSYIRYTEWKKFLTAAEQMFEAMSPRQFVEYCTLQIEYEQARKYYCCVRFGESQSEHFDRKIALYEGILGAIRER